MENPFLKLYRYFITPKHIRDNPPRLSKEYTVFKPYLRPKQRSKEFEKTLAKNSKKPYN